MLAGKGFKKVFNVSGGIKAWQSKTAVGPQDLGINLFNSNEEPLEVLKVAYSMEQGLREFYLTLGKEAKKEKVKALFSKLADIEVQHQMSIYIAYNNIATEDVNKATFEKMVETKALEGGLSTEEYLDLFKPDLSSATDVISLAMSIEAQALDLYQRVSTKIENKKSKDVINKIANEEKMHLASLGKLMDSLDKENKS
jgi:rubrerythrin